MSDPKVPIKAGPDRPEWVVVSRPGAAVYMATRELSPAERAALTVPDSVRFPPPLPSRAKGG